MIEPAPFVPETAPAVPARPVATERAAAPAAAATPEHTQASAAERQREEWARMRGAGSEVLKWYDALLEQDPGFAEAFHWSASEVVPPASEVLQQHSELVQVTDMDRLLRWGIGDYTLLPRVLGRGRFSCVYLAMKDGVRFAIKHTPLFPHQDVIATRLLREPKLLAELPSHPNLVDVRETIRTPGHFYLVEEYLDGYTTLESLVAQGAPRTPGGAPTLSDDAAEKILSQLLMALHAIHWPLRVCHRDVKPENVMVHPETLQLKLLDFGLATHFSKSRPKLTTCCGSPAFHCPEIVSALIRTPDSAPYWGPEVDAWTCGVTMLRCVTGVRYPLGTSHTSLSSMSARVRRALALVTLTRLREQIGMLLDMHGEQRMRNFDELVQYYLAHDQHRTQSMRKELKSTSFLPAAPQHTMSLQLAPPPPDAPTHALTLLNPTRVSATRILSFVKYCLRCAGILYHRLPVSAALGAASPSGSAGPSSPVSAEALREDDMHIFQCVLDYTAVQRANAPASLVDSLLTAIGMRAPPKPRAHPPRRAQSSEDVVRVVLEDRLERREALVFHLAVRFLDAAGASVAGSRDSTGSRHSSAANSPIVAPNSASSPEAEVQRRPARRASVPTVSMLRSSSRASSSEVDSPAEDTALRIDTRPELLPPTASVMTPYASATTPRSRRSRTRPPHDKAAHCVELYLSDARAVGAVRTALGNAAAAGDDAGVPSAEPAPAVRPAEPVAALDETELARRLDAIDTARRAAVAARRRAAAADEQAEEMQRRAQSKARARAAELHVVVSELYERMNGALASGDAGVSEACAALNFRTLEVLTPTLALVDTMDQSARGNAQHASDAPGRTTGCLAFAVLETVARCTSAKEMSLGLQEQIERVVSTQQSAHGAPAALDSALMVQELLGLVRLLASVLPAVQTRNPGAYVDMVESLLFPHVFGSALNRALQEVQDAEVRAELAVQAAVQLCELLLALRTHTGAEGDARLGGLLIDAAASLLPFLPQLGEASGATRLLAQRVHDEMHPDRALPARSTKRSGVPPGSHRLPVWNVLRKTANALSLDLGAAALRPHAENDARARDALVLLVQLLAYEAWGGRAREHRLVFATAQSTHLGAPARWSTEVARELLARLADAAAVQYMPGLTRMDAPPSSLALQRTQSTSECDAFVTLLLWNLQVLTADTQRTPLDSSTVVPLVRAAALIACFSPLPRLRQLSFAAAMSLVRDWSSDALARSLLVEMLAPQALPALRASAVNLVRDVCRARLEAGQDAGVWRACASGLFVLPPLPPPPPLPAADKGESGESGDCTAALSALEAVLAEHASCLVECSSLYYYLRVRHVFSADEAHTLGEQFLDPALHWAETWQAYLEGRRAEDAGAGGGAERVPVAQLSTGLLSPLTLVRTGLERAREACAPA